MFTLLETMKNRDSFTYRLAQRQRVAQLVLLAWFVSAAAHADPQVSGRVLDEMQKPLRGVQVKLLGDEKLQKCLAVTGNDGEFRLAHENCEECCLAVYPPKNLGLATEWIDHIPGNATRHIIIQLRPGFAIKGRVISAGNGKGLKGLTLGVSPITEKSLEHEVVYGSGLAVTGYDGGFRLTLTPGLKDLSIANDRYPELVKHFNKMLKITDAGVLPDIALPTRE